MVCVVYVLCVCVCVWCLCVGFVCGVCVWYVYDVCMWCACVCMCVCVCVCVCVLNILLNIRSFCSYVKWWLGCNVNCSIWKRASVAECCHGMTP